MDIQVGEIYAKRHGSKMLMYSVLKITKKGITLQNFDNPLSLFESTTRNLEAAGYSRISQTPYIDTTSAGKKRKLLRKATRCPYTTDLFEGCADCDKPQVPSLF